MRIILSVFMCLGLAACATKDEPPATIKQGGVGLYNAHNTCVKRGLKPGSYNFDTCYRARPEVQAHERQGRLQHMGIIKNNRSAYAAKTRSYPVE